ncbi:MAG: hypothetical protein JXB00_16880 [Bacteroidales bacterium]|nr:hypothetical protein [Bacteroidales bacterium]
MKRPLLFFLIQLLTGYLFSQADPVKVITENDMRDFTSGTPAVVTNMDALYEGVHGTPYLSEEWLTGDILFTDNKQINGVKLKYNVYKDELEYLNSTSGKSFVVQREQIKGFRIQEDLNRRYFEGYQLKAGKNNVSFVEVVYSGSIKLLVKHKKTFIPADYKGAYSSGVKYDEYKDDKEYYAVLQNGEICKIKLNRKQVLEMLSSKKDEIEKYISEKQPDLSNLDEVLKILTYFDNLN